MNVQPIDNERLAPAEYIQLYLIYWQDFISTVRFAEYYGVSVKKACKIVNKGRLLYNDQFGHH